MNTFVPMAEISGFMRPSLVGPVLEKSAGAHVPPRAFSFDTAPTTRAFFESDPVGMQSNPCSPPLRLRSLVEATHRCFTVSNT